MDATRRSPLSTCRLKRQLQLSEKLLLILNLPSQPIFSVPVFVLSILLGAHLTSVYYALFSYSVFFPLLCLTFFSILLLYFSVGMHLCWLLSTVGPVSSLALWFSLCWASWLQNKEWTSVRWLKVVCMQSHNYFVT